uniref:Mitochondrial import receptor subunit TOM40-1-like n=1 Tax=Rhizophora mucronata TaxID=61149 RepID=A0A2P2MCX1_RHIMU
MLSLQMSLICPMPCSTLITRSICLTLSFMCFCFLFLFSSEFYFLMIQNVIFVKCLPIMEEYTAAVICNIINF